MIHGVGVAAENIDQAAVNELEQPALVKKRRLLGIVADIGLDHHADILELGYHIGMTHQKFIALHMRHNGDQLVVLRQLIKPPQRLFGKARAIRKFREDIRRFAVGDAGQIRIVEHIVGHIDLTAEHNANILWDMRRKRAKRLFPFDKIIVVAQFVGVKMRCEADIFHTLLPQMADQLQAVVHRLGAVVKGRQDVRVHVIQLHISP